MGDRGADSGTIAGGEGVDYETGDSGCRFEASEAVRKCGENRQGGTERVTLPESWKLRIAIVMYSSAASGSPYSVSSRDKAFASNDRLRGYRCLGRSSSPDARRPSRAGGIGVAKEANP